MSLKGIFVFYSGDECFQVSRSFRDFWAMISLTTESNELKAFNIATGAKRRKIPTGTVQREDNIPK